MQGFDKDFLADAGFPVDQQRNVFFQQALGLAHGFFHPAVTKVQGAEAEGLGGRALGLGQYPRLDRPLLRALEQAMKAIAPRGLQGEGQAVGLVEQFQQ
ncbi:hypothetical protein D3C85_1210060 [compost metagenome]